MHRSVVTASIAFTLSGVGTAVASKELIASQIGALVGDRAWHSGRVRNITLRQELAGGATACVVYLATRRNVEPAAPSTISRRNLVVAPISVAVMTPSATVAFTDQVFTGEPAYVDNLSFAVEVTAGAGAWTLDCTVEFEQ